jgi:hypothetical protein
MDPVCADVQPSLHGLAFFPAQNRIPRELHKGSSNTPFPLFWSLLFGEAMVCLVHLVLWAVIEEFSFVDTCHCFEKQFWRLLGRIWKPQ